MCPFILLLQNYFGSLLSFTWKWPRLQSWVWLVRPYPVWPVSSSGEAGSGWDVFPVEMRGSFLHLSTGWPSPVLKSNSMEQCCLIVFPAHYSHLSTLNFTPAQLQSTKSKYRHHHHTVLSLIVKLIYSIIYFDLYLEVGISIVFMETSGCLNQQDSRETAKSLIWSQTGPTDCN